MIVYEGAGDLLNFPAETIACPVNTRGVMGAGLALAMKRQIPGLYEAYRAFYLKKLEGVGWEDKAKRCFLYPVPKGLYQVLCLPTKNDWKKPSKLEYIEANLEWVAKNYEAVGIHSLALPKLGCGLGNLPWMAVRKCIYEYLDGIALPVRIVTKPA